MDNIAVLARSRTNLIRYRVRYRIRASCLTTPICYNNPRLEAEVTFKIIRSDLFGPAVLETIVRRFEREAKALAKLNIVALID